MEQNSLFSLITPLMLTTFGTGFITIYLYDKQRKSPLFFALSYFSAAIAFSLDFLRPIIGSGVGGLFANLFYMLCASSFVAATGLRYKGRIPIKQIAVLSTIWAVVWIWLFQFQPDVILRTYVANFSAGCLFGIAAYHALSSAKYTSDKVLGFFLTANALQFFIRTTIVLFFVGDTFTIDTYTQSLAAVSMHLTVSVIGLAIAGCLFLMHGMEIVSDLKKRSDYDMLTSLLNRRGFEEKIGAELSKLEESPVPCCLIVCDLDHFKAVNDRFGHSVGDEVLELFGCLVRDATRRADLSGRVGGEEFCLFLRNCNMASAHALAQSLRTAYHVQSLDCMTDGEHLSASFGIAEHKAGMDYQTLFKEADTALLQAKRQGRNRVVMGTQSILKSSAA